MNNVLIKTWVWSFYKTYSGVFFVLILILFGMFRAYEHLAIAQFLVGESINLLYVVILFIPYGYLIRLFSTRLLKDKRYLFIYALIHLPLRRRILLLIILFFLLSFPIVLYLSFLTIVAVWEGMILNGLIIVMLLISFILFFIILYHHQIIHPVEKTFGGRNLIHVPIQFKFSWIYLIFKHLFFSRAFSVLLTKLFSFLSLLFFTIILSTVDEYHRFLAVAVFITMVSNAFISFEIHFFMMHKMPIIRNLPFHLSKIWLIVLISITIFVLPEIVYIFRNYGDYVSVSYMFILVLNGISFLMLGFGYLIKNGLDQKKFIMRFYWGFLILILLILFDTPLIILSIVLLASSFIIFKVYFYKFEEVFIGQQI